MAYCSVTSTPQKFGNCLSNFQLEELLVLKKSLERMSVDVAEASSREDGLNGNCMESEEEPPAQRMALMASERGDYGPSGGGGGPMQSWHSDHSSPAWVEAKPSKLQTLFQISITALAFLSFGGYLLCLIVQAIKSKGTTYFHPVATATSTSNNGNVKRIKIYRRSKRSRGDDTNMEAASKHLLLHDYASYMRAMRGYGGQQEMELELDYAHLVGS